MATDSSDLDHLNESRFVRGTVTLPRTDKGDINLDFLAGKETFGVIVMSWLIILCKVCVYVCV